jgi:hypothetical protein
MIQLFLHISDPHRELKISAVAGNEGRHLRNEFYGGKKWNDPQKLKLCREEKADWFEYPNWWSIISENTE